jgi:hypothetical protein
MVTGRKLAGEDAEGALYAASCECGFTKTSSTRYAACPREADDTAHPHENFTCVGLNQSTSTSTSQQSAQQG